jgi:hypothetical protein
LKNKCSRIENQGKQRVLLIGRKKKVEVNGEDNSRFRKQKPRQKGHPHPWRDETQHGQVCQILLLWKKKNLKKL